MSAADGRPGSGPGLGTSMKSRRQSELLRTSYRQLKQDWDKHKDGQSEGFFEHYQSKDMQFEYKALTSVGRAIHVASLHPNGTELVLALLALRANPNEEAVQEKSGKTKTHMPIHIASSVGNLETVIALLDAKADVHAKSKLNGKDHYAVIHEAAYFDQAEVVKLLLQRQANVNERNTMTQQTPLHLCAKMDAYHAAHVLAVNGADKYARDVEETQKSQLDRKAPKSAWLASLMLRESPSQDMTCSDSRHREDNFDSDQNGGLRPLDYVLESTSRHTEAFHFADRRICEVLRVAKKDPDCAARLMKDRRARKGQRIHKSWIDALLYPKDPTDTPTVHDLIELMSLSPEAATDLLEVLTIRPEVTRQIDYPLRRSTVRQPYERMRCEYREEVKWEKVGKEIPDWHDRFLPDPDDGDHGDRVNVRVQLLKLAGREGKPGVIYNGRLLYELAETGHKEIFKQASVQAIIDYTWVHLVRKHHMAGFLIRLLDLCVLFVVVLTDDSRPQIKRLCWFWCAATCFREAHILLLQYVGYCMITKNPIGFISSPRGRLHPVLAWLASVVMIWSVSESMDLGKTEAPHPHLLCGTVLLRWLQVVHMLHAYRYRMIGYELVPVIESFFKVVGIALILVVSMAAFTHAFLALNLAAGEEALTGFDVFLGALRLLSMSDGDGIGMAVALGNSSGEAHIFAVILMMLGVLFVCIGVLNIFIAVHGDQYAMAKAYVIEDFYSKRARACLHSLFDATATGPFRVAKRRAHRRCSRMRAYSQLVTMWNKMPRCIPLAALPYTYLLWLVCGLSLFCPLVWFELLPPVVAAALLAFVLRSGDQHLMYMTHTASTESERQSDMRKDMRKVHCEPEEAYKQHGAQEEDGEADGNQADRTSSVKSDKSWRKTRYIWWASWDLDEAEQDHITSIAQEVHETNKLVGRSRERQIDQDEMLKSIRKHLEDLKYLPHQLEDLKAQVKAQSAGLEDLKNTVRIAGLTPVEC